MSAYERLLPFVGNQHDGLCEVVPNDHKSQSQTSIKNKFISNDENQEPVSFILIMYWISL